MASRSLTRRCAAMGVLRRPNFWSRTGLRPGPTNPAKTPCSERTSGQR